ncbi:thioesterase family protein [Stenotrophomonas maltophilia]
MIKRSWNPVNGTAAIQFKRELKPFRRFTLDTQLIGWPETKWVIEHRVMDTSRNVVAATAIVLGGRMIGVGDLAFPWQRHSV